MRLKHWIAAAIMVLAGTLAAPSAAAQTQPTRLPLDTFIGYDTVRGVEVSPSGRYIAFIRREAAGDLLAVLDRETRVVTPIQGALQNSMQIDFVEFKSDERLIFGYSYRVQVTQQRGSADRTRRLDDAFIRISHVMAVGVDGSGSIMLFDPRDQNLPRWFSPRIVSVLPEDPDHILLRAGRFQLWRVNVATGDHTVVEEGSSNTITWFVDRTGAPVLRQDVIAGGRGFAWFRRGPGQTAWTEIVRFMGASGANSGPTFEGVGPALQPGQVFVLARRDGQDTSGLYVYDTATGAYVETVHVEPGFDLSNAILDTEQNAILAACWWGFRWTCEAKDEAFARYWYGLVDAMGENLNVRLVGRAGEQGNLWLVQTDGPQDLGTYYLYDISTQQLSRLITARPGVNAELLPTQQVVHYTASDGMELWGYLWLPPGVTSATNLPLIVVPHGGPEGRDVWGFDPFAITFASQGYAVFQPNFRGGGGFGRAFVEAGHRQWGQRMQQDVADGAQHLISTGVVDANRICIAGWSYGGYVAFTAAFENADLFRCSMAGAGVSDLMAMLRWVRLGDDGEVLSGGGSGSQGIAYRYWTTAIGDPARDREMLERFSAARNIDRIRIPLLIIHGDEDQTVPIEQSEIMVRGLRRAGMEANLLRLEGMDHFFTMDQGDHWRTALGESLRFFERHIGPGVAPPSQ
jgi:dipeptidyl aminopeptidase/acylaminoacyl peptidase